MGATIISGPDELTARVGTVLGVSDWFGIDQNLVTGFGELTHDVQWIHVDAQRAAATRFGGTIVHGYLLLALLPHLAGQAYRLQGWGMTINYGLDRVRFPESAVTGLRVRNSVELTAAELTDDGVKLAVRHTVTGEGLGRPVLVADQIRMMLD